MMKKSLLSIFATAAATTCLTSHAATFYMGPSIGVEDAVTNTSVFRGMLPRLTLGYGEMQEGGYFAGELFFTPTSILLQNNTSPGATTAKMTRDFGASFIPGMIIGPQTVGFARLGFITSKFSGPNVYKTGGQVGLGLMTAVSPNWDVRGEYNYSMYPSMGSLGAPKVDSYFLHFLYRFGSE